MAGAVPEARPNNVPSASGSTSARPGRATAQMSRSPSLARSVSSSKTPRRRPTVNTLERNVIPDHQWWPRKERIIVDERFFSEDDSDIDQPIDRLSIQSAERLRQAILEIDEEGSAAHRWLPGVWRTGAFAAGFAALSALAMDPSSQALADEMQEAAGQPSGLFGFTALEGGLLVAPIFLYLVFIVYRTSFNPKAKALDFLFFVVSFFVVANISSILFLKTRLF